MIVYLAGPISNMTVKSAHEWRSYAANLLLKQNILTLNPVNAYKDLVNNELYYHDLLGHIDPMLCAKAYSRRDLMLIRKSDLILANFLGAERVSIFTMMEIGYAIALQIPYITIQELDNPNSHHVLTELAAANFNNLDDAIKFSIRFLAK